MPEALDHDEVILRVGAGPLEQQVLYLSTRGKTVLILELLRLAAAEGKCV